MPPTVAWRVCGLPEITLPITPPVNHTPRTWEATIPSRATLNQPPCLPSSSPVLPCLPSPAPCPGWLGTSSHTSPRKPGQGMQLAGSAGFQQSLESHAGAHAHPTHSTGRIQVWEERWARTLICVPVLSPQSVRDWAPLYLSRAKKAAKGETVQLRKQWGWERCSIKHHPIWLSEREEMKVLRGVRRFPARG